MITNTALFHSHTCSQTILSHSKNTFAYSPKGCKSWINLMLNIICVNKKWRLRSWGSLKRSTKSVSLNILKGKEVLRQVLKNYYPCHKSFDILQSTSGLHIILSFHKTITIGVPDSCHLVLRWTRMGKYFKDGQQVWNFILISALRWVWSAGEGVWVS